MYFILKTFLKMRLNKDLYMYIIEINLSKPNFFLEIKRYEMKHVFATQLITSNSHIFSLKNIYWLYLWQFYARISKHKYYECISFEKSLKTHPLTSQKRPPLYSLFYFSELFKLLASIKLQTTIFKKHNDTQNLCAGSVLQR